MSYNIQIKKSAEKDFKKIPIDDQSKIKDAILELEKDPRPSNCKKLKNRPEYRIRIGDYRVLYSINDESRELVISLLGHRRDIYK
ncbi:MAG: type II toxin-antitoxin system RelE/ParE family toxin [Leptospira sp.]|nr:type II toxin-antitoxin system RelE/ParE family toxin [Leptospira sp.]